MHYGGATTEGKSALVKILARASCYDVMLFTRMEDIEAVIVRCLMDFTYNGSREREREDNARIWLDISRQWGGCSNCSRTLSGPLIAARRPAAPLILLDNPSKKFNIELTKT